MEIINFKFDNHVVSASFDFIIGSKTYYGCILGFESYNKASLGYWINIPAVYEIDDDTKEAVKQAAIHKYKLVAEI